jgi:GNAT superfamily N-acetyltransferase
MLVCVGSLQVLPEYRRKGYANVILQDLCKQYDAFYKRAIPNNTAELYFGAGVERFNDSSANLFRKAGWTSFGLGITWIFGSKAINK